jgi:hypothetical protein
MRDCTEGRGKIEREEEEGEEGEKKKIKEQKKDTA